MSMSDEHVDTLVRELIEFDPSLKEHEAHLRVVMTLLAEKKPDVRIDTVFVETLRARLMSPHQKPTVSPYAQLSWWALRLAPIGAVALLVFMLLPQKLHYIEVEPPSVDDAGETEAGMFDSTPLMGDTMINAKSSAPQNTGDGGVTDTLRVGVMESTEAPVSPDRFEFGTQLPGTSVTMQSVTFTRPGFVVIHAFGQNGIGPVVGISPLQNPGTTVGVPIYLRTMTRRGETYYAALYYDNGNRVFSVSDDELVVDPMYGVAMGKSFTIGFDTPR
jgi:hypothetical protein